jgi:hypothetical protein
MKKIIFTTIALTAASIAYGQFAFNTVGETYSQNFNTFTGTEGSLPANWSFEAAGGTDIFRGVFNSNTNVAGDFTGVMAATSGSGNSIVWRESTGAANLSDGRLLFSFTNNTGQAITSLNFSYELEAWVRGARVQELRFKYDTLLDDPDRSVFQTDILARAEDVNDNNLTRNPGHGSASGTVLDGNTVKTTVTGTIFLSDYLIDESVTDPLDPLYGQTFGALQPGETAYVRWQISNIGSESGNRSALGINHFELTAVPEPQAYAFIFGFAAIALVTVRRRLRC